MQLDQKKPCYLEIQDGLPQDCPRCWFGHCPNDWYSYIPECISAERYPQKFLLDAIWSKFVE